VSWLNCTNSVYDIRDLVVTRYREGVSGENFR
jgi:hypothetical protein